MSITSQPKVLNRSIENGSDQVATAPLDSHFATMVAVAAHRLAAAPFGEVTLDEIASDLGVPLERFVQLFPTMHGIGSLILDHERQSMRDSQELVYSETDDPLTRLVRVFQAVGANLCKDIVVRAGVRIATESRHHFPERRLDPFRTWEKFVAEQLDEAQRRGELRADLKIGACVNLIVTTGMGVKDLVTFRGSWAEAETIFEDAMTNIVDLISGDQSRRIRSLDSSS